jgi:cell division protein FtsQ
MQLNAKIKKLLVVTTYCLLTGMVLALMSFAEKQNKKIICKGVLVNIKDENIKGFIDRNDIMEMVLSKGNKILGNPVADINMNVLEKIMDSNPYVYKAEVYSTIDGWLHIDVKQRNPLVRIINKNDESFYIDNRGKFMPLSEKYTDPVMVANGYISEGFAQKQVNVLEGNMTSTNDSASSLRVIDQVYLLASHLAKDSLWNAMFEQIYVNAEGEIELIARIGNQVILFGDFQNADDKLDRLKTLYTNGFPATGWDNYDLINLKFKGQVVCRKKNFKQS